MIQKTVSLLVLLALPLAISSPFILISEKKNWVEAQAYCRQYHVDMATVQTDEDRKNIQNTVSGPVSAWMGLYGGLCQWRWSYLDQDVQFSFWDKTEDVSSKTQRMCAVIRNTGKWFAVACDQPKSFFCYKGEQMDSSVALIAIKKSWRDAQIHCRTNFVDLASIADLTENFALLHYLAQYNEYEAWIGLRKNLWLWSDQSKVTWLSLKWTVENPDNGVPPEECVFVNEVGLLDDNRCKIPLPFFCLKRTKTQVLRVAVKSSGLLDESAMTTAIQKKIKIIFSELEMDPVFSITWKVQPDGKIFQPMYNNVENNTAECKRDSFYEKSFY